LFGLGLRKGKFIYGMKLPQQASHHFMWTPGKKGGSALKGVKPVKLWDVLYDLLELGAPGSQSRLAVLRTARAAISRAKTQWHAARWNVRMFRLKNANHCTAESRAELQKAIRTQHVRGRALGRVQKGGVEAQWSALVFIRANQREIARRLVEPISGLRIQYVLAKYLIPSAIARFFRGLSLLADSVLEPSVVPKTPRWNTERDVVILLLNAQHQ